MTSTLATIPIPLSACDASPAIPNSTYYLALTWSQIERGVDSCLGALKNLPTCNVLLALARGGTIPAIILSHRLQIREVRFFRSCRTRSNEPHDYGGLLVQDAPRFKPTDKVLIVEDIIYEGETLRAAVNAVLAHGAKPIGAFALVVDESFLSSARGSVPVVAPYVCGHGQWIRFPWETPLRGERPALP